MLQKQTSWETQAWMKVMQCCFKYKDSQRTMFLHSTGTIQSVAAI